MSLIFYSGGQQESNHSLHDALYHLAGPQKNKSFTYVPFCYDNSQLFYERAVRRYQKFGFSEFHCFSPDRSFTKTELRTVLRSDVIYLAGGNTFYFLSHLRRSGVLPELKKYAEDGGVLAGLSAGGLILTPHIKLAGYPSHLADENEVGLKNLNALNLVSFEFYPHYQKPKEIDPHLLHYSELSNLPLLACTDGSGIIVTEGQTTFLGEVILFDRGQKLNLTRPIKNQKR